MEVIDEKAKTANRVFWLTFIFVMVLTISFAYWNIILNNNYQVVTETSCDTATESCFELQPDACAADDTECLANPPEVTYYKKITKSAAEIYKCEQSMDKDGCANDELTCTANEIDCSYTFCNPADLIDGEVCAASTPAVPETTEASGTPETTPETPAE